MCRVLYPQTEYPGVPKVHESSTLEVLGSTLMVRISRRTRRPACTKRRAPKVLAGSEAPPVQNENTAPVLCQCEHLCVSVGVHAICAEVFGVCATNANATSAIQARGVTFESLDLGSERGPGRIWMGRE